MIFKILSKINKSRILNSKALLNILKTLFTPTLPNISKNLFNLEKHSNKIRESHLKTLNKTLIMPKHSKSITFHILQKDKSKIFLKFCGKNIQPF